MYGDFRDVQAVDSVSSACDERVAAAVARELAATGRFLSGRVEVSASGDAVVLRGRVSTYYQKQLAQAVALRVIGGHRLENNVDVR